MIKTGHYFIQYFFSMNLLTWHFRHIFSSGNLNDFSKNSVSWQETLIHLTHITRTSHHPSNHPHTPYTTQHTWASATRTLLTQPQYHWITKGYIIKVIARVDNPRTISFDTYACSNHQQVKSNFNKIINILISIIVSYS